MQTLDLIVFTIAGVAALAGLAALVYASLPIAVLASAERHGRFQGLLTRERLASGTPTVNPPVDNAAGFHGSTA